MKIEHEKKHIPNPIQSYTIPEKVSEQDKRHKAWTLVKQLKKDTPKGSAPIFSMFTYLAGISIVAHNVSTSPAMAQVGLAVCYAGIAGWNFVQAAKLYHLAKHGTHALGEIAGNIKRSSDAISTKVNQIALNFSSLDGFTKILSSSVEGIRSTPEISSIAYRNISNVLSNKLENSKAAIKSSFINGKPDNLPLSIAIKNSLEPINNFLLQGVMPIPLLSVAHSFMVNPKNGSEAAILLAPTFPLLSITAILHFVPSDVNIELSAKFSGKLSQIFINGFHSALGKDAAIEIKNAVVDGLNNGLENASHKISHGIEEAKHAIHTGHFALENAEAVKDSAKLGSSKVTTHPISDLFKSTLLQIPASAGNFYRFSKRFSNATTLEVDSLFKNLINPPKHKNKYKP